MISDRKKRILGKLFKRYKENQNASIIDIEYKNISSTKTLYQAFNGEIIKNSQFYIDYCSFFNHQYKEDIDFELWLENYIFRIIRAFDYYEEKNFDSLYYEFNIKFNNYKECAIYYEYYQVIQSLFNYYLNHKYLRLEEVEDYLELINIDLLPSELSLYLLDYMFRSNWNYIGNKTLPKIIVNKMERIDETHYITKYQRGFLHKFDSNYIQSLKKFNQCVDDSKEKNNKYREVQSLLAIYTIYRNIDDSLEKETANMLIEYKKDSILPESLKHNINYNVGMQDYLTGRYESAYELFDENLIKYNSLFTLLFQCSICSRLDKEYPKELFSNEIEDRYDFIYLNYFRMKHNQETNEKLAKYILKAIVPKKLKDEIYRNPYWSLFEYELHDLAEKDKKLKKYYVNFMKEVKKYCKDA